MTRTIVFSIATIIAVLAAGVSHGLLIQRWGGAERFDPANAPFEKIPLTVGSWQGETLEGPTAEAGQAMTYFVRRYVNTVTGKAVTVALTWGRPGPVSVHTPDVCYNGNGFEISPPERFANRLGDAGPSAVCFTSQFKKTNVTDSQCLRAFWTWNPGDGWVAPDNPRLVFARYRKGLLKVYLVNEMSREAAAADADPCVEFMPAILPEIQKVFFPG